MSHPAEVFETKCDFAYRQVRDQILSGQLEPGSVIQQRELASVIGISTTPLREALRRLKSEGLVELDAHRDAHVASLSAGEARDLVEVRRALDPLAAALAAERRTAADIQGLRAAALGLEPLQADPGVEQLVAHRRFHAAIYQACRNDLLIDTLEALWNKADRYRRLALQVDRDQSARDKTAAEHAALLESVIAGDALGAATTMSEHIDTSLGATAAHRLGRQPGTPGTGA